MRYLTTQIIKNVTHTSEIPTHLGEAIYVWVALTPKSSNTFSSKTTYVGQTHNIYKRQHQGDHRSKFTGDMDLIIFNIEGSILNQRQVLEHLVYEFIMRSEDEDYQDNKLNKVQPLLPRVIPKRLLDEVFDVFSIIKDQLTYYLMLEHRSKYLKYLQPSEFIDKNQKKGYLTIIEPTIQHKQLEIYNPQSKIQLYQPKHLVEGTVVYTRGKAYKYTYSKGRMYIKDEEIIKYITAPHIQEDYLEPLYEVAYIEGGHYQHNYVGI